MRGTRVFLGMIVVTPRRDDECHCLMTKVLTPRVVVASLNHRAHGSHVLLVSTNKTQFSSARRGRNFILGSFGSLSTAKSLFHILFSSVTVGGFLSFRNYKLNTGKL